MAALSEAPQENANMVTASARALDPRDPAVRAAAIDALFDAHPDRSAFSTAHSKAHIIAYIHAYHYGDPHLNAGTYDAITYAHRYWTPGAHSHPPA